MMKLAKLASVCTQAGVEWMTANEFGSVEFIDENGGGPGVRLRKAGVVNRLSGGLVPHRSSLKPRHPSISAAMHVVISRRNVVAEPWRR